MIDRIDHLNFKNREPIKAANESSSSSSEPGLDQAWLIQIRVESG
jgi:hypothetical protein